MDKPVNPLSPRMNSRRRLAACLFAVAILSLALPWPDVHANYDLASKHVADGQIGIQLPPGVQPRIGQPVDGNPKRTIASEAPDRDPPSTRSTGQSAWVATSRLINSFAQPTTVICCGTLMLLTTLISSSSRDSNRPRT